MPRSSTLFMPGYTPSYDTGILTVLHGYFRDRGADSAPAGSGLNGRGIPAPH